MTTNNNEEFDENISSKESENLDLNYNQQFNDNDVNQIQDIEDYSSVQITEEADENISFKEY